LLLLGPNPPELGEEEVNALQDAHLAHLAELHDAGHLLAAGPLLGGPDGRFGGRADTAAVRRRSCRPCRQVHGRDPAVDGARRRDRLLAGPLPTLDRGGDRLRGVSSACLGRPRDAEQNVGNVSLASATVRVRRH